MVTSFRSKSLLLALGCFSLVSTASASLIPANPFELNLNGTGFGTVSTIITLQTANGQTNTEAGCVGYNNLNNNCGITQNGKIKNTSQLEPVPAGVTDASQLRFIFNASQPAGTSITLNDLQVSFYGNSATPLFTASLLTKNQILTSTYPGVGNSGFTFMLDATQAAAVNQILGQTTSIGGGFSATGATGGQDTLFLGSTVGTTVSAAPEPGSYILLGTGLLGLSFVQRRRQAAARR